LGIWSARFTAVGFAVALCSGSTVASAQSCNLALVLAMDASKSMSSADFDLAFQGTAAALRSEEVQAAILAQDSPIALIAFEWSGRKHQQIVHDWSVLRSREDIEQFAASLERHERGGIGQKTGTGSALAFSYALLESGPDCARRVVDLSSDGYSSDGMTPAEFYAGHPPADVTVNALVIGGDTNSYIWRYFRKKVLHGPGAFGLAIVSFQDYPRAIKEKLLREVSPPRFAEGLGRSFPVH
jgi:Ca-activated chloride channel homolog